MTTGLHMTRPTGRCCPITATTSAGPVSYVRNTPRNVRSEQPKRGICAFPHPLPFLCSPCKRFPLSLSETKHYLKKRETILHKRNTKRQSRTLQGGTKLAYIKRYPEESPTAGVGVQNGDTVEGTCRSSRLSNTSSTKRWARSSWWRHRLGTGRAAGSDSHSARCPPMSSPSDASCI